MRKEMKKFEEKMDEAYTERMERLVGYVLKKEKSLEAEHQKLTEHYRRKDA